MSDTGVSDTGVTDTSVFTRRTARLLTVPVVFTLAVTLFFMIFGQPAVEIESAGADSFSRSALGYRALVELLEHEVPVLVSRQRSAQKASPTAPLLLLEPPAGPEALQRLRRMIKAVRQREVPTVVVLPKWRGWRSRQHRGWVSRVALLPAETPSAVLQAVLGKKLEADLVRSPEPDPSEDFSGDVPRLGAPQLIRSAQLETVVRLGQDAVVARLPETKIYVVSDPDLLNTAGLARQGHALLVHELLVGRLDPQAFVIDEVLHGYGRSESIWNALLELPLICLTLHLAALLALALWATTSRFGRPLTPPSRLPPGKLTLVENTARLLALAERGRYAVQRYLRLTVRRAARSAGIPQSTLDQQVRRLAALGRRRGVSEDLEKLAREVDALPPGAPPRRALELSRALYRWRKELLRES